MTEGQPVTGLTRRERTGSQKRPIGVKNIQRMLPGAAHGQHGGNIPPGTFSGDTALMAMEDSYCDMWDRTDVIDLRTRSLFNVSLMIGVGNVSNQFELKFHAPGAIYNGATVADLEAIIVHARAYVGSPCAAWAMTAIVTALNEHHLIFDLWERTHVLDRRTRSVVTLGMIMGLGNHNALRDHVPVALRNGLSVPELEELVYQAATYLGYVSGSSIRATIADALRDSA